MNSSPIEVERLSELIGVIYDCAVDPGHWETALEAVRQTINCHHAALTINELPSGRFLLTKGVGVPQEWLASQPPLVPDLFALWQPVVADMRRPLDEPAAGSREFSPETWNGNRYITEWARPQGICDTIALFAMRDADRLCSYGFARHETHGLIGEHEMACLRLLAPHLRRAVVISNIIDTATVAAATFESTLESLNVAIALVDSRARLVFANCAAKSLLDLGGAVRLDRGVLQLHVPAANAALSRAIALTAESEVSIGAAGLGIPAPGPQGGAQIAHVLPLPAGNPRRQWIAGATAAVFLTPSSAHAPIPLEAIMALYDLTPAEARVLAAIASGKTLTGTATELAVAESTVKTHLLRIFSKTGTSRQAELAQLISSLTAPVRGA